MIRDGDAAARWPGGVDGDQYTSPIQRLSSRYWLYGVGNSNGQPRACCHHATSAYARVTGALALRYRQSVEMVGEGNGIMVY